MSKLDDTEVGTVAFANQNLPVFTFHLDDWALRRLELFTELVDALERMVCAGGCRDKDWECECDKDNPCMYCVSLDTLTKASDGAAPKDE